MSSWFSNLQELSKDLTAKVQAAVESETFQKLTLSTPELKAEREAFQQEYRHQMAVQDSLAHMYPWETRDRERDILVEECREAIMALSSQPDTFFGPYEMPALNVVTQDELDKSEDDGDTDHHIVEQLTDDKKNDPNGEGDALVNLKEFKDQKPSPVSLEKLNKLEPLPPLLDNFDLVAHIGLIKKMLKIDSKLVECQSKVSGGGEREKVFWRNYFFHCAYTRYEAGLSIDEIWSDDPSNRTTTKGEHPHHTHGESSLPPEDEVVEFRTNDTSSSTNTSIFAAVTPIASVDAIKEDHDYLEEGHGLSPTPASSEYDMVESNHDLDEDVDVFSGEMDELEAEIAQALGD